MPPEERRRVPVVTRKRLSSALLEVRVELGLQLVGGFAPSSPFDRPQPPLGWQGAGRSPRAMCAEPRVPRRRKGAHARRQALQLVQDGTPAGLVLSRYAAHILQQLLIEAVQGLKQHREE